MRLAAFLHKGPRYLWAYADWRARRFLRGRRRAEPAWPRGEELAGVMAGHNGDHCDLDEALRNHFDGRRSPVRLADWNRRAEIARRVPAANRLRTLAAADAIVERRFTYRGQEMQFGGPIDWQAKPGGNTDWCWDLNRHHFFVVLGRAYWYSKDERYVQAFASLLEEWLEANPPAVDGPAWRSVFEVGVRVANWCWAHALFLPSPVFTASLHKSFLCGFLGLARFLAKNVERHVWNNHLLLEAKALSMCGLLYPELPGAPQWRQQGLKLLGEELERQVLPDGVHSERSSLYHAIIASELLEHLVVLRLSSRGERDPHYCKALVRLVGMTIFQAAITRVDGTRPLLGDASRTDEHVRFDAPLGARLLLEARGIPVAPRGDENLVWLLAALGLEGELEKLAGASSPVAEPRASRAFPSGGYHVLEASRNELPLHMVFDCGPFGDRGVPGHGHADALSIDVAVGSTHCLVDPGMYSAHLGVRWRNYFRGTSAHNTVVVDGRDQSILDGVRRVFRPATAQLIDWASCDAFDVVAGRHLGYTRLRAPITHQREICFRKPRYWLVVDRLDGQGEHTFELFFHLPPGARVELDVASKGFVHRSAAGSGLAVLPVVLEGVEASCREGVGAEDDGLSPQGWVAYQSGVKEPSPVVRYARAQQAPAMFANVLVPLTSSRDVVPSVARSRVLAGESELAEAVAGSLQLDQHTTDMFLSRPLGGSQARSAASVVTAGELETDADLACVTVDAGARPQSMVLHQGNSLRHAGVLLARFDGGGLAGSFGIRLEGRRLFVESTGPKRPGAELELGGSFASAEQVFLNGKDAPVHRSGDALRLQWRG